MNSNPSVAICIPAYNHGKYLPNLFRSILDQTYPNLQIFFSDDGSTDNTAQIANEWFPRLKQRFSDVTFVRSLFNAGDLGYTNAKTITGMVTSADYIQICDSDDYFKPDKIEKQISYLRANPEFSAVHTDVEAQYEDGTSCLRFWKTYRNTQTPGKPDIPVGFIRQHLEHCNFIYTCAMLVRTDLFKKHNRFDYFLKDLDLGFGDYPFFLSLSKEAQIGYIDEPLSVYRVLSESVSHSNRQWVVEKTELIKKFAREGAF